MQRIFSPGKLLLTSEYFVLDGALALALPTRLGQELFYFEKKDNRPIISWEAKHLGKDWLKVVINYHHWKILETNLKEEGEFVLKVLKEVAKNSNSKFKNSNSYSITTNLQFPSDFGLGSSSTLMNNLAQWAAIDAFKLNETCLGGSGYDIAVAQEKSAILYQRKPIRKIIPISFHPDFTKDLIFVHLNQKQNSREGINHYMSFNKSIEQINLFSELTKEIMNASSLEEFSTLMMKHEELISTLLKLQTVKEKFFSDYGGFIKSLGAWGGDFVLASKFGDYKQYFNDRDFNTIFEYNDLID